MTVIRINAITVSPGAGDELAHRFAKRAGAVDNADGFEGFELLRPTDERDTWLVLTRWRDQASFEAPTGTEGPAHRAMRAPWRPIPSCGPTRWSTWRREQSPPTDAPRGHLA
jgi:heme-degrading monooxygenase HmoA